MGALPPARTGPPPGYFGMKDEHGVLVADDHMAGDGVK